MNELLSHLSIGFGAVLASESLTLFGLTLHLPMNLVYCLIGAIIGTGIGGLDTIEETHTTIMEKGPQRVSPFFVPKMMPNAVAGNINLSVGNGQVDFTRGLKALADAGYDGHFTLELETRDITNDQRPAATARAAQLISGLI